MVLKEDYRSYEIVTFITTSAEFKFTTNYKWKYLDEAHMLYSYYINHDYNDIIAFKFGLYCIAKWNCWRVKYLVIFSNNTIVGILNWGISVLYGEKPTCMLTV